MIHKFSSKRKISCTVYVTVFFSFKMYTYESYRHFLRVNVIRHQRNNSLTIVNQSPTVHSQKVHS